MIHRDLSMTCTQEPCPVADAPGRVRSERWLFAHVSFFSCDFVLKGRCPRCVHSARRDPRDTEPQSEVETMSSSSFASEEELEGKRRWQMTTENAYEALVRKAYEDFQAGDLGRLRLVMADEVIWHEPGRSPFAGDHKGPEAVMRFLAALKVRSGGTFKTEVLDVLSEPGRAVVFQRETATRGGKDLDVIAAVDFEIHQGKITEVTVYQADGYQFDEFWADSTPAP